VVSARYVRNRRLADALHQQALCSLSGSAGARAHYDRQREAGASHHKLSEPSATVWSASSTAA
jgi:hypothetical protein